MVYLRIAGLLFLGGAALCATLDDSTRQLSRDIFRELIEINTTDSVGSTTQAAEAMAARLKGAGFAAADVQVGRREQGGELHAREDRLGERELQSRGQVEARQAERDRQRDAE